MFIIRKRIPFGQIWVSDTKGDATDIEYLSREVAFGGDARGLRIGCVNPDDGETNVTIADENEECPTREQDFVCEIDTPSRKIEIADSEENFILVLGVGALKLRISIWMDHPIEPDNIFLRIEAATP